MKKLVPLLFLTLLAQAGTAQNAGIGVPSPAHARLEIAGSIGAAVAMFAADKFGVTIEADNPEIGFNYFYNGGTKTIRSGYAAYMGMMPPTGDFYIGTFNSNQSASNFGAITGAREAFRIKQNGNIGFGADNPYYPVTIRSVANGGGLVQESPDGTARIGFYTSLSAAYLQTWTNTNLDFTTGNGPSRMVLNTNGSLTIKKSLNVRKVISAATGASNLLPLAFGTVSQAGVIIQSTDNLLVTHSGTGQYQLSVTGEDMAADAAKYTILLTPKSSDNNMYITNWINYYLSGGQIIVNTGNLSASAQFTVCGCNQSYLTSGNPAFPLDCPFDITIYKNN